MRKCTCGTKVSETANVCPRCLHQFLTTCPKCGQQEEIEQVKLGICAKDKGNSFNWIYYALIVIAIILVVGGPIYIAYFGISETVLLGLTRIAIWAIYLIIFLFWVTPSKIGVPLDE